MRWADGGCPARRRSDVVRFSAEMLSTPVGGADGLPNKLSIHTHDNHVYIEIKAVHDGAMISSVVVVERAVWRYHMIASGVLS